VATVVFGDFEWDSDKADVNVAKHGVSFEEASTVWPMSNADNLEPSAESVAEMPEVDFADGVRPNRLANLRGEFRQAVFLDQELWEQFGSEERVLEALRLLVQLARNEVA
jgi:hypothetical protein